MKLSPYEPRIARRLLPLVRSIGQEIVEREARLETFGSGEDHETVAETAIQRRELRHAYAELEKLGCSVVGHEPLTLRIPAERNGRTRSLLWQLGRVLDSTAAA